MCVLPIHVAPLHVFVPTTQTLVWTCCIQHIVISSQCEYVGSTAEPELISWNLWTLLISLLITGMYNCGCCDWNDTCLCFPGKRFVQILSVFDLQNCLKPCLREPWHKWVQSFWPLGYWIGIASWGAVGSFWECACPLPLYIEKCLVVSSQ